MTIYLFEMNMVLSEQARKLRNQYAREYRKKNPEKIKKYNIQYWERKADPIGAKVRQLRKQGLSQRAIAEKLSISLGSVNAILKAE